MKDVSSSLHFAVCSKAFVSVKVKAHTQKDARPPPRRVPTHADANAVTKTGSATKDAPGFFVLYNYRSRMNVYKRATLVLLGRPRLGTDWSQTGQMTILSGKKIHRNVLEDVCSALEPVSFMNVCDVSTGGTRGGLGSRPARRQPARLQGQNQIAPTAEEPFQKVLGHPPPPRLQTSSFERVNNPPRGSRGGHRPRLDEEQSQRLEVVLPVSHA